MLNPLEKGKERIFENFTNILAGLISEVMKTVNDGVYFRPRFSLKTDIGRLFIDHGASHKR